MNMGVPRQPSIASNIVGDRNTETFSEKKWDDIWGILSWEPARMS